MSDRLIVPLLANGAQLVLLIRSPHARIEGAVHLGMWPLGHRLAYFSIERSSIRVYNPAADGDGTDYAPSIWFGDISPDLAWHQLLKVADFLQLEIPLPHPLPGDESAAEASA